MSRKDHRDGLRSLMSEISCPAFAFFSVLRLCEGDNLCKSGFPSSNRQVSAERD